MSTSPLTPRQSFRETVALVAARAKEKLPQCNGRVEKATTLVLAGDVTLHPNGTATVFSATDPTRRYELGRQADGYCMCKDWDAAPGHLCKHRLAAMILTRVQEELPAPVELPHAMEVWGDNDPEPEPDQAYNYNLEPPAAPVPQTPESVVSPLPEAPVSITLKAMLHGHEVLVTLRGTDFASVKAQVEEASAWLKAQAPAVPAAAGKVCPIHHVPMQENHKENRSWWSHKTADGWCKGRKGR